LLVLITIYMSVEAVFGEEMWKLYQNRKRGGASNKFFMFFSSALLVLITIYMSVEAVFGEEMWIVNAGFPGGDAAYMEMYASVWYQTMGTGASVVLNLLCDGLMIYRCFLVWNSRYVVLLPCFLWVSSLGLGAAELYASGSPGGDFFSGLAVTIGLAYYSTSIALNVLVTSLICGRILLHARRLQNTLGRSVTRAYTGVASIIIESALPYTLSGITFLVSYGSNSQTSTLFLSFYVMFTCISPQMLVLRVVTGRAWTKETTYENNTAIAFPAHEISARTETDFGSEQFSGTSIKLRDITRSEMSLENGAVTSRCHYR